MLWKIPRIWEDGRCFIIGGGTSILQQFEIPDEMSRKVLEKQADSSIYAPCFSAIHNEHIIGVNMAMKLGSFVDVVYFADSSFWKRFKSDIIQFQGIRCTTSKRAETECDHSRKIKYLQFDRKKKRGITTKESCISWNFNSGGGAINLAVHFGVRQIILLGFDMNLDQNKNQHWHKQYGHKDLKKLQGTFAMHMRSFPVIAEDARKLGIEILNANPNSAINDFKKVNIKDIL